MVELLLLHKGTLMDLPSTFILKLLFENICENVSFPCSASLADQGQHAGTLCTALWYPEAMGSQGSGQVMMLIKIAFC